MRRGELESIFPVAVQNRRGEICRRHHRCGWRVGGTTEGGTEGQGGGGVDGLLSEDGCGIWQMMPQQHQRERREREALTKDRVGESRQVH